MKEIPMLFSTPMVVAELDGRKTMTRRMKGLELVNMAPDKWSSIEVDSPFKPIDIFWFEGDDERIAVRCPYGQPGDLIYVRETWAPAWNQVLYKANERYGKYEGQKWKPSIHMPKEAARIWLQVTSIKVERLKDITEEDAKAEGVEKIDESIFCWKHYGGKYAGCSNAKTSFQSLWQSINGDESWQANPWVWVVSFKVLSTTGKP